MKSNSWRTTILLLAVIAAGYLYVQQKDYREDQKNVVFTLPDEVRDCLPDDELTTSIIKINHGQLDCEKHTNIPDAQKLARLKLASPIKPRSTYE